MADQQHNADPAHYTDVSLRNYVETLVLELQKRMDSQFAASKEAVAAALASAEKAVSAALVAQDKLTAAAFVAAKEALAEAQAQLGQYKIQSNEWRGTLTDIVAKIMTRQEIEALLTATSKSITETREGCEARLTTLERTTEKGLGDLRAERGQFVLREYYDKEHNTLRSDLDARLKALENNAVIKDGPYQQSLKDLNIWRDGVNATLNTQAGRSATWGTVSSLVVGFIVLLLSHFWK